MIRLLRANWLLCLLLVLGGLAAYGNSFGGVFTFDDRDSILSNRTIRELSAVHAWMHPPAGGITVSGRPGLNLSLALNWAWTGRQVWSYHLVNLLGHLTAGLALFGLVRRTLIRIAPLAASAQGLAFSIALLWVLHPLQTESVTYIVQRAEMLMGLCYLGSLLCFVRSVEACEAGRRRAAAGWSCACVLVCVLGITFKEVMVSAPVMMFFYDRTFLSGSFAAAWHRRGRLWLALALTWIPLGYGVLSSHSRGGTAGFGVAGITFWQYIWTQGPAIMRYLLLTFWPHPLVLDYGFEKQWLIHPWSALPANLVVAVLAAASLYALWRAPRWGFLGFWYFSILAPTSLVPGARQSLAEHRMYLALAPLLAGLVIGVWCVVRRYRASWRWSIAAVLALSAGEAAAVRARNRQFDSDLGLWRATVAEVPDNAYARTNLGASLYLQEEWTDARAEFSRAARLDPNFAAAESNLGMTYQAMGQHEEAIRHIQRALRIDPHFGQALNNLGVALGSLNRWSEAKAAYAAAINSVPDFPDAALNLGVSERVLGDYAAAETDLQRSVALAPENPQTWYDLALAYQLAKEARPAAAAYAEVVRLRPDFPNAEANWGAVLVMDDQRTAALAHFNRALALDPTNADTLVNRGVVLAEAGKTQEAAADYRAAIRVRPTSVDAWADLGMIQFGLNQYPQAVANLKTAVGLAPDNPQVRYDYALALAASGDRAGAEREYLDTIRLNPDLAEPRNNLATLYASTGDLAQASAQLQELLRRHPEFISAHVNLALIYRATGRPGDAQREEERAEQLRSGAAK